MGPVLAGISLGMARRRAAKGDEYARGDHHRRSGAREREGEGDRHGGD